MYFNFISEIAFPLCLLFTMLMLHLSEASAWSSRCHSNRQVSEVNIDLFSAALGALVACLAATLIALLVCFIGSCSEQRQKRKLRERISRLVDTAEAEMLFLPASAYSGPTPPPRYTPRGSDKTKSKNHTE